MNRDQHNNRAVRTHISVLSESMHKITAVSHAAISFNNLPMAHVVDFNKARRAQAEKAPEHKSLCTLSFKPCFFIINKPQMVEEYLSLLKALMIVGYRCLLKVVHRVLHQRTSLTECGDTCVSHCSRRKGNHDRSECLLLYRLSR